MSIRTQPHTHILGLSRARVRLSLNYSNYLSSKHSLPWLPPGIQREAVCVELRMRGEGKNSAEWSERGDIGSLRVGGVDDFMYWGGTGSGGSWFSLRSPPSSHSLLVPSQTLTSGGK